MTQPIDWSLLQPAANAFAGAITKNRESNRLKQAWEQSGHDYNKMVQNLFSMGDTASAAKVAAIAHVMERDKPTYGKIGSDSFGNDTMGWIDSSARTVTPAQGANNSPGSGNDTVSNLRGDEYLQTLDPQIQTQVKALSEGRMPFPSGFALKSPYWQKMISAVSQYDPSFDSINFNSRNKTRADFTSGKSAQSVNALNTVTQHLRNLSDMSEALDNGDYQTLNRARNWFKTQLGSSAVTNFDTTKVAVMDELERVWRGTGGSDADIQRWSQNINSANSPTQLRDAIYNITNLIGGKTEALNNQYQQGMGTDKYPLQITSPQAKKDMEDIATRAGHPPAPAQPEQRSDLPPGYSPTVIQEQNAETNYPAMQGGMVTGPGAAPPVPHEDKSKLLAAYKRFQNNPTELAKMRDALLKKYPAEVVNDMFYELGAGR